MKRYNITLTEEEYYTLIGLLTANEHMLDKPRKKDKITSTILGSLTNILRKLQNLK